MEKVRKILETLRITPAKKTKEQNIDRVEQIIEKTKSIPIKKLLLEIDEITIGYVDLKQSIFFNKIPQDMRLKFVKKALSHGYQIANEVLNEFPNKDPIEIAKKMKAETVFISNAYVLGKQIIFSEYDLKKSTIYVYEGSILYKYKLARLHQLGDIFPMETLISIHVAHELYHHITTTRAIKNEYLVDNFKVGPIHLKVDIRELYDVAADSFARNLLRLKYCPRVLDYFLTENPQYFYEAINKTKEGAII